jgi:DnaD/phage-associated family protein
MDLWKVIAEMSGEGQNLVIPRLYVKITGGHNEALVLKQLVFWENKTSRTDGYFYKKSEELEDETLLTRRQIDGIVKKLVEKEFIEVKRKKANGFPTRHFKINQKNIVSRLHETVQRNAPNGANQGLHETVQTLTDSNTYSNNRQIATTTANDQPNGIDEQAASSETGLIDHTYQTAQEAYMKAGWGLPNGFTSQTLISDIGDYGVEIVLHAIEIAAIRNAKSYGYTKSIYKDWSDKQLKTIDDVKRYEEAKQIERTKRNERPHGGNQVGTSKPKPKNDFWEF